MDNSPAWDAALARVPTQTATAVVRRDTMHVDAAMRPSQEDYLRFIHLVDLFRDTEWQPAPMMAASPFRVVDVGTNAILLRALRDLLALAGRFGTAAEAAEIAGRIARTNRALDRLWSETGGVYQSYDLIGDTPIAAVTSAALLPLFGGGVPRRASCRPICDAAALGAVSASSGSLDGSRRSALRAAAVLARPGMGGG